MSDRTTGAVPRNARGAVPVRERKRRPAWLWPLLALLLLAVIVIALISLLGGDDKKKSSSASAGSVTAGSTKLLPLPASGKLAVSPGQDTLAKNTVVQSVVPGEGFWIGTSSKDRVYVEYGGAAGKTESGFKPTKAGQKVNLDGPVRPAPPNPVKTLKLSQQDAAKVTAEGGYINANKVSPAQ